MVYYTLSVQLQSQPPSKEDDGGRVWRLLVIHDAGQSMLQSSACAPPSLFRVPSIILPPRLANCPAPGLPEPRPPGTYKLASWRTSRKTGSEGEWPQYSPGDNGETGAKLFFGQRQTIRAAAAALRTMR